MRTEPVPGAGALVPLVLGNLLVIYAVVSDQASVLYTAYAPLQAHWTFYIGLALVVVSTWAALANMLVSYTGWRREHPGERVPLPAYISLVSYVMWFLASLPIAVSFLAFLTPWSLGLVPRVDPLLTRTLFWFTGHAIVYAWLLPAYVSWYALVPRQAGGKVISDAYTRVVWILFLLLSIPTGLHHQYTDPGISQGPKAVHGVLTFVVFFPSLATAFSVMAALEMGGRRRGGRARLGNGHRPGAHRVGAPAGRHLAVGGRGGGARSPGVRPVLRDVPPGAPHVAGVQAVLRGELGGMSCEGGGKR